MSSSPVMGASMHGLSKTSATSSIEASSPNLVNQGTDYSNPGHVVVRGTRPSVTERMVDYTDETDYEFDPTSDDDLYPMRTVEEIEVAHRNVVEQDTYDILRDCLSDDDSYESDDELKLHSITAEEHVVIFRKHECSIVDPDSKTLHLDPERQSLRRKIVAEVALAKMLQSRQEIVRAAEQLVMMTANSPLTREEEAIKLVTDPEYHMKVLEEFGYHSESFGSSVSDFFAGVIRDVITKCSKAWVTEAATTLIWTVRVTAFLSVLVALFRRDPISIVTSLTVFISAFVTADALTTVGVKLKDWALRLADWCDGKKVESAAEKFVWGDHQDNCLTLLAAAKSLSDTESTVLSIPECVTHTFYEKFCAVGMQEEAKTGVIYLGNPSAAREVHEAIEDLRAAAIMIGVEAESEPTESTFMWGLGPIMVNSMGSLLGVKSHFSGALAKDAGMVSSLIRLLQGTVCLAKGFMTVWQWSAGLVLKSVYKYNPTNMNEVAAVNCAVHAMEFMREYSGDNVHRFDSFDKLYNQFVLLGASSYLPSAIAVAYRTALTRFVKKRSIWNAHVKQMDSTPEGVGVCFHGSAGMGKSWASIWIRNRLAYRTFGRPEASAITFKQNPMDQFYEGNFNFPFWVSEEALTTNEKEKAAEFLQTYLRVLSSDQAALRVAFEQKGEAFANVMYWFWSSNFTDLTEANTGLKDVTAVYRRTVMIQIQRNDGDKDVNSALFRVVHHSVHKFAELLSSEKAKYDANPDEYSKNLEENHQPHWLGHVSNLKITTVCKGEGKEETGRILNGWQLTDFLIWVYGNSAARFEKSNALYEAHTLMNNKPKVSDFAKKYFPKFASPEDSQDAYDKALERCRMSRDAEERVSRDGIDPEIPADEITGATVEEMKAKAEKQHGSTKSFESDADASVKEQLLEDMLGPVTDKFLREYVAKWNIKLRGTFSDLVTGGSMLCEGRFECPQAQSYETGTFAYAKNMEPAVEHGDSTWFWIASHAIAGVGVIASLFIFAGITYGAVRVFQHLRDWMTKEKIDDESARNVSGTKKTKMRQISIVKARAESGELHRRVKSEAGLRTVPAAIANSRADRNTRVGISIVYNEDTQVETRGVFVGARILAINAHCIPSGVVPNYVVFHFGAASVLRKPVQVEQAFWSKDDIALLYMPEIPPQATIWKRLYDDPKKKTACYTGTLVVPYGKDDDDRQTRPVRVSSGTSYGRIEVSPETLHRSSFATAATFCGSPVYDEQGRVTAIHAASSNHGTSAISLAVPISKNQLQRICPLTLGPEYNEPGAGPSYFPQIIETQSGETPISMGESIVCGVGGPAHLPTESKLVESPLKEELEENICPIPYEPVRFSKDLRYEQVEAAYNKRRPENELSDVPDDIIKEAVLLYKEDHGRYTEDWRQLTEAEAILGVDLGFSTIEPINLNTAAGAGFPGQKSHYIKVENGEIKWMSPKLREALDDAYDRLEAGMDLPCLFTASLKDELRASSKSDRPRMFFTGSFVAQIVQRMFFAGYFACLRRKVTESSEKTNVNWHNLVPLVVEGPYQRLRDKLERAGYERPEEVIRQTVADGSGWDRNLVWDISRAVIRAWSEMAEDNGVCSKEVATAILSSYSSGLVRVPTSDTTSHYVMEPGSHCSGSTFCIDYNNGYHWIMDCIIDLLAKRDFCLNRRPLRESSYTGDDFVTFAEDLSHIFGDGGYIDYYLQKKGDLFRKPWTNPEKTGDATAVEFDEIDYCSRKPVWDPTIGRHRNPLELSRVLAIFAHMKTSSDFASLQSRIDAGLIDMWHHGYAKFTKVRNILQKSAYLIDNGVNLLSYDEVDTLICKSGDDWQVFKSNIKTESGDADQLADSLDEGTEVVTTGDIMTVEAPDSDQVLDVSGTTQTEVPWSHFVSEQFNREFHLGSIDIGIQDSTHYADWTAILNHPLFSSNRELYMYMHWKRISVRYVAQSPSGTVAHVVIGTFPTDFDRRTETNVSIRNAHGVVECVVTASATCEVEMEWSYTRPRVRSADALDAFGDMALYVTKAPATALASVVPMVTIDVYAHFEGLVFSGPISQNHHPDRTFDGIVGQSKLRSVGAHVPSPSEAKLVTPPKDPSVIASVGASIKEAASRALHTVGEFVGVAGNVATVASLFLDRPTAVIDSTPVVSGFGSTYSRPGNEFVEGFTGVAGPNGMPNDPADFSGDRSSRSAASIMAAPSYVAFFKVTNVMDTRIPIHPTWNDTWVRNDDIFSKEIRGELTKKSLVQGCYTSATWESITYTVTVLIPPGAVVTIDVLFIPFGIPDMADSSTQDFERVRLVCDGPTQKEIVVPRAYEKGSEYTFPFDWISMYARAGEMQFHLHNVVVTNPESTIDPEILLQASVQGFQPQIPRSLEWVAESEYVPPSLEAGLGAFDAPPSGSIVTEGGAPSKVMPAIKFAAFCSGSGKTSHHGTKTGRLVWLDVERIVPINGPRFDPVTGLRTNGSRLWRLREDAFLANTKQKWRAFHSVYMHDVVTAFDSNYSTRTHGILIHHPAMLDYVGDRADFLGSYRMTESEMLDHVEQMKRQAIDKSLKDGTYADWPGHQDDLHARMSWQSLPDAITLERDNLWIQFERDVKKKWPTLFTSVLCKYTQDFKQTVVIDQFTGLETLPGCVAKHDAKEKTVWVLHNAIRSPVNPYFHDDEMRARFKQRIFIAYIHEYYSVLFEHLRDTTTKNPADVYVELVDYYNARVTFQGTRVLPEVPQHHHWISQPMFDKKLSILSEMGDRENIDDYLNVPFEDVPECARDAVFQHLFSFAEEFAVENTYVEVDTVEVALQQALEKDAQEQVEKESYAEKLDAFLAEADGKDPAIDPESEVDEAKPEVPQTDETDVPLVGIVEESYVVPGSAISSTNVGGGQSNDELFAVECAPQMLANVQIDYRHGVDPVTLNQVSESRKTFIFMFDDFNGIPEDGPDFYSIDTGVTLTWQEHASGRHLWSSLRHYARFRGTRKLLIPVPEGMMISASLACGTGYNFTEQTTMQVVVKDRVAIIEIPWIYLDVTHNLRDSEIPNSVASGVCIHCDVMQPYTSTEPAPSGSNPTYTITGKKSDGTPVPVNGIGYTGTVGTYQVVDSFTSTPDIPAETPSAPMLVTTFHLKVSVALGDDFVRACLIPEAGAHVLPVTNSWYRKRLPLFPEILLVDLSSPTGRQEKLELVRSGRSTSIVLDRPKIMPCAVPQGFVFRKRQRGERGVKHYRRQGINYGLFHFNDHEKDAILRRFEEEQAVTEPVSAVETAGSDFSFVGSTE